MQKKRYAMVGMGSRSEMYRDALTGPYAAHGELVACADRNYGRLQHAREQVLRALGREIPLYDLKAEPEGFARMLSETHPDTVIVTTMDAYHHHYIVQAMQNGCHAISEKPMTIDAEKCQAIIDAQRETGRNCRVTFNYRYSPPRTQMKEILMSGVIGDILSVDFQWMLDTHHGADYFRRWHSNKANSGGLLVHKATHHFDLVNWWLSTIPETVFATGKREFYTPEMARRLGLESYHERCLTCPEREKCSFCLDLPKYPGLKQLYLDHEQHDGYWRDRCVFRPEIDIEDHMQVLVKYENGVTMNYSLVACAAWEGYSIAFNGTRGRIEHRAEESVYLSGDGSIPGALKGDGIYIRIYPLRKPAYEIPVWQAEGGHGGGDKPLLDDIFLPEPPADKYIRAADQRSGAYSILTGAAANLSIVSGKTIRIADLVQGIGYPNYPQMPSKTDGLSMP